MEKTAAWRTTSKQFRDYLITEGRSEGTANTYVANLWGFWRACARYEITPYEADRAMIREWMSDRLEQVSASRVHNDLAALKLFYKWLVTDVRDRTDNPTDGLRVKRTKKLPTKPMTNNEIECLLLHCKSERDRLIILMLGATGARISELAGIHAEDIDWSTGLVTIRGKGDKERLVAPRMDVLNRLRAFLGMFPAGAIWLSQQNQSPLAAHQIRKILYRIASEAKIEDVHPHRLRASFATAYIDQHGDIQALQGVMGHESIETTSRYTEYTKQKRGLEQMRRLDFLGPQELAV